MTPRARRREKAHGQQITDRGYPLTFGSWARYQPFRKTASGLVHSARPIPGLGPIPASLASASYFRIRKKGLLSG